MNTKDFIPGDKIKIKNSITCTIMEVKGGWLNCCWMFHNKGRFLGEPDREMQLNSFRAKDVEHIVERNGITCLREG